MKIIHCADIHLGSKMESRLPKEKAEQRKREVRATFNRMIEYAKKNSVSVILLAGDIFDSDRPLKRDKELFYSAVKQNPDIDFLYLRGNHDGEESYTETLLNLKTFGEEWTYYTYGNVVITGLEITSGNSVSMYSTLHLDPDKKNIVMLHGDVGSRGINLTKLRNKNIDYLALGHIHKRSSGAIDGRGTYAYSGCLEGRGFDETGEKGFILLDVGESVTAEFVPFAERRIEEFDVDVTGAENSYGAYAAVKKHSWNGNNLLRVNLVGEITFSDEGLAGEVENLLASEAYFVSVKDATVKKIDYAAYKNDISLRGEFVRVVLADGELSEEQKQSVIAAGLKALKGQGADL